MAKEKTIDLNKMSKSQLQKLICHLLIENNNLMNKREKMLEDMKQAINCVSYGNYLEDYKEIVEDLEFILRNELTLYYTTEINREKVDDLASTIMSGKKLIGKKLTLKKLTEYHNENGEIELTEMEVLKCLHKLQYPIIINRKDLSESVEL